MLSDVEKYCIEQQLFKAGDSIIVACSGGPDSLALLMFFITIRDRWQLSVKAAHFEHGIRGDESQKDAEFVKAFCDKYSIQLYLQHGNVPQFAKINHLSVEDAARKLRYAFLRQTARENGGALIATAHHADDQAETVLMHVLRGTGTDGLAAIKPYSFGIIRPFLFLRKETIVQYCSDNELFPRYDSTNQDTKYLRNRLRLELIPQLEKDYNPQLCKALCSLADIAAAETDFLKRSVDDVLYKLTSFDKEKVIVDRIGFNKLHLAQKRILLKKIICEKFGIQLGFERLTALIKLFFSNHNSAVIELQDDVVAERVYNEVHIYIKQIISDKICYSLQVPGETVVKELGIRVKSEIITDCCSIGGNKAAIFDLSGLSYPFFIRTRENGDIITTKQGIRKLKKLFIDAKLPRKERDRVPIITDSANILWAVGFRIANIAKISPKTEKYIKFEILDYDKGR